MSRFKPQIIKFKLFILFMQYEKEQTLLIAYTQIGKKYANLLRPHPFAKLNIDGKYLFGR